MARRARRGSARIIVLAGVLVLAGAACTEDEPATELPCEFYVSQYETGAIEIDDVPEQFRDAVRGDETCAEAESRSGE